MSRNFNFALIVCILIFWSCGKSSRNKYFVDNSFEEFSSDAETEYIDTDVGTDTEIVTCPICGGLGYYQFNSDDLMAPTYQCWACNGSGECDVESAQQAMQSKAQLDALINGQDLMNGSMPSGDLDVSISSSSDEYQCANCYGSGRCSYCAGRGWTKPSEEVHDCWICHGTGKCQSCYGKGSHYR